MTVPFSLVLIKSTTIGRDEGPKVLQAILDACPVALVKFRPWVVCSTTQEALRHVRFPRKPGVSWICLFTHQDRETDPHECLSKFIGPNDCLQWKPGELRHKYGAFTRFGSGPASDNVAHLSDPNKAEIEAMMLFERFATNNV